MACPLFEDCESKFQDMNFAFLHRIIKVNYCNYNPEKCKIKQLYNKGEEIPEGLMPNGDYYVVPKDKVRVRA